jgi:long-subunit fatty acid transport protein
MKKFFAVILMVLSFTVFNSSSASATDFLIGLRGGYFIWEPWIKDVADFFGEMDSGNGVLYGPVASVMLTDNLTLSFSGLFGSQQGEGLSEDIPRGTQYMDVKFGFKVFRMDIDGALSYRLTDNFKIFAGYKYWYLKTEYTAIDYRYNAGTHDLEELNKDEITFTQPFHGPAAGIGFSLPIGTRGCFIAANVSGLYMWGKLKIDNKSGYNYSGLSENYDAGSEEKSDMKMYGVNVEPTIGLNPGEGLPIITAGVRYQYNRMKLVNQPVDMEMNSDWMTDKIYGFFVGLLYQI